MHRLLERQLKYSFGKEFDLTTLDDKIIDFISRVNERYNAMDEEQRFLENTIKINSEELTEAYKTIKAHNVVLKDEVDEHQLIFEQYTTAIDASYLVSKTDRNGIITYVNDVFCQISGYTRDELIGSSHNIVRHPDNSDTLYRDLWNTISGKKRWIGQIKNRAKDGSAYYVISTIFPLIDSKGMILEYIAIRTNITQRVVAKKKLDTQMRYNQMLFNEQENITLTISRESGVVNVNKKFLNTFGFHSLKEFKKNHTCVCELFISKVGYLEKSFDITHWSDIVIQNRDIQHKAIIENKYGQERIYSVLVTKVSFDDKPLLIASFADITELEVAIEIAETSLRAKADFMANMSHEIRTPMNSIVGFAELLAKSGLSDNQKQHLNYIEKSTQTLLSIVNDILDFSKIESGKMEIHLEEVNPFIELQDAIGIFSATAREKNISLLINIDSALSECVQMDKLRIVQILNNLIVNALKFTPQQGTVSVGVKQISKDETSEMIRFSVSDTGIGIAENRLNEIFESFIQEDSSTTRNFGGTGLGLSISQSLCELMNSRLHVESKQNVGSTFFFDLEVQDCIVKKSLSSQVHHLPVYIVKDEHVMYDSVLQQLTNFKIIFREVYIENIPLQNDEVKTIILFDHKLYHHETMQVNNIILIDDTVEAQSLLQKYTSIHHIYHYDECPSLLYNVLLGLDTWDNVEVSSDEPQFELSVLVAEDYEMNRILISEILQRYNITPTFASNGEEAVQEAKCNTYDMIFMDINMPVLNGVDACKAIRKQGILTPIIALTANALEGDKEYYLSEGMNDYLSKPIELSALLKVLQKYSVSQVLSEKEMINVLPEGDRKTLDPHEVIENLLIAKEKMYFSITIMKKLFESFVISSYESANILLQSVKEKDMQVVKEKAHAIRGGALSLNLNVIAKLCNEIEYDEAIDTLSAAEELKKHIDMLYDGKSEVLGLLSTLDIS